MKIKFKKFHSCGNDFILLDQLIEDSALIQQLCDRHRGIGGDGLICVLTNPLRMRYFNQDGTEAPMCGNGLRCFSQACFQQQKQPTIEVETSMGNITVRKQADTPFRCGYFVPVHCLRHDPWTLYEVSGTRHLVLFEDFNEEKARIFEEHLAVNVNFVQVLDLHEIKVETWEKGVGKTLACGTGACAAAMAAYHHAMIRAAVTVQFVEDSVLCLVNKEGVLTEGPSHFVFEGVIEIDD